MRDVQTGVPIRFDDEGNELPEREVLFSAFRSIAWMVTAGAVE